MRLIPLLALTVPLLVGSSTSAAQEQPLRSISVSGTVETKVAPDYIDWHIKLVDMDGDLFQAKQRSDEKARAVIALRDRLGIELGDMSTGKIRITREYEREKYGGRGPFKHFIIERTIKVRQRDLKRFDEYLSAFVSSADLEVDFSYESSRFREIRAETRLEALRVARDKAAALVEVVDTKLGRVLTITEDEPMLTRPPSPSNIVLQQGAPLSADMASDTFVPGDIKVRITVHATFELE